MQRLSSSHATFLQAGGYLNASRRDYDLAGSWSQKYNLIWDRVFGFGLFDDAIERECKMIMVRTFLFLLLSFHVPYVCPEPVLSRACLVKLSALIVRNISR